MTKLSEGERLVVVETKLDIVIEQQKELIQEVKSLASTAVPRPEYEETVQSLRVDIENAKKRSAITTWLTSTLAAIFGVIMTILVTNFFS